MPNSALIVGHLAHELRQPLSAMEAIAYYLHMTVAQDPRARTQIEKLQSLIEQTSWILSDAVHYLQSAPPKPELTDLHEALDRALAGFEPADRHTIALALAPELPLLPLDPQQTQHLLTTALRFCLRAARQSHTVEIKTSLTPESIALTFSTQSHSHEAQLTDALFSPFHDHPAAAAGLGLASIRRIAEVHGGACTLASEPSGRLTLWIVFPVCLPT